MPAGTGARVMVRMTSGSWVGGAAVGSGAGVDVAVDGAWVGDGVGATGVEVGVGVGVGDSGAGVGSDVTSGFTGLTGNGVVAALRPGVAVGTNCGAAAASGAGAADVAPPPRGRYRRRRPSWGRGPLPAGQQGRENHQGYPQGQVQHP